MDIKTLKPDYLFYRIQDSLFKKRNPNLPWLTKPAIHILETWLKDTDTGWEWGSGRSTAWFAKHSKHVTSIEHEKVWYDIVSKDILKGDLGEKVDYQYHDLASDSYENSILEKDDESLDYILVDGRKRYECMVNAIGKLKSGGLLILDNSDRYVPMNILGKRSTRHPSQCGDPDTDARWQELKERLEPWRMFFTTNHIWDTIFWVKP